MRHNKKNELYTQVEDTVRAIEHLNIALSIALHDKEQFEKEYGKKAYNLLRDLYENNRNKGIEFGNIIYHN